MNEFIPLSKINTFIYCPRRFYYEFVQQEMLVNEHVEEGKLAHARTDEPMQERHEKGNLVSRRQYLASQSLGVSGFADLLEEKDGMLYPVEYKKGRTGNWLNDKVQLCLQGMLLEESMGKDVPFGYIYYITSNRRRKIALDDELRKLSLDAVRKARNLAEMDRSPEPVHDNRCNGCSLQPLCLPFEVAYLHDLDKPPKRIQPTLGIENVLYVDETGASLKKQGGRILVCKGDEILRDMPVINIGQVVISGNVALTTPVMQWLMYENIPVIFLSMYGKYQGALTPQISKNSLLRVAQHKMANDGGKTLSLAKQFVIGKLTNMRTVLRRRNKEKSDKMLSDSIAQLAQNIKTAKNATHLDQLLGIEGAGSAAYFNVFGRLLKSEMGFDFQRRSRRPPADPTNSLLSFAYTLLTSDLISAIQIVGLDPFIGFYHQLKYGRPCLALDLMEEFRPIVADAVVLALINRSVLKPEDFTEKYGGWFLKDGARKKFYAAYEGRKNELVTHPVFRYKLSYRRAFELQARILAKYLIGEIDEYKALTVK